MELARFDRQDNLFGLSAFFIVQAEASVNALVCATFQR
jgi:hypothetical protein